MQKEGLLNGHRPVSSASRSQILIRGLPARGCGTLTSQACPMRRRGGFPGLLLLKQEVVTSALTNRAKTKPVHHRETGECKEHRCDFRRAIFESFSDYFGHGFYRLLCSQLQRAAIAFVRWWQKVTESATNMTSPHIIVWHEDKLGPAFCSTSPRPCTWWVSVSVCQGPPYEDACPGGSEA